MSRQTENRLYILLNYILGNFVEIDALRAGYPDLIFESIAPGIFTVEVPPDAESEFQRLSRGISALFLPTPYGLNAIQALEASNILPFHNYPYGALRGNGVLVGFVDTGIDYTNPYFQNADGTTRIVAIWDQTLSGSPPVNYSYGTLYSEAQLNEALRSPTPLAVVPTRDEIGHGTFLAGVAAGNDQSGGEAYTGGAPDADIAMVKLRPASNQVVETYLIEPGAVVYQDNDLIAGINYLVQLALERRQPLVICIGIGSNVGAHNGTEVLEEYLNNLSTASDIVTVIAAGNEGNTGHHYRGSVDNGETNVLEINVEEGEIGFQMFTWVAPPDKMTIALRSPLGQVVEKIAIRNRETQNYQFNLENTVLDVTYIYPDPLTGGEKIGIRLQNPTPGIWSMTVYGDRVINGVFHVWLPRRNFIKEGTRFLRPDPDTTVGIPGTATFSIVVGSYDYLDNSVSVFSGRGPTSNGVIKPELLAPGVNVTGPSITGGLTSYTGTSTAAAITASAVALLLQWGVINGNLAEINTRIARGILIRGARRQEGVIYPNNIEGYGRLDLQQSILEV